MMVFPFRVDIADSSLTYLGEGMADLLSAALAQQGGAVPADAHSLAIAWREANVDTGGMAAVASRAIKRVGATRAILGTIVGDRARINVSAEIISESGKIESPAVQASGSPDSILAIVDRLTSALLAGQASQDPRRLADLTTRSPAALRHYLRALSAVRAGENARAVKAFFEAMHTDTSFALAALGVATTGGWADRTLADRAKNDFALGSRLRSRLEPQEKSLFDAAVGSSNPTDDTDVEKIARWLEAMRTAPGRADVVYGYGDRLFHTGGSVGIADADQRAERAFASAVGMDSTQLVALEHLIELAIARGDLPTAKREYHTYLARDSRSDAAAYLGWRITAAVGSADEQRILRSRFEQFSDGSLRRVTGFSQIDGIAIADGARALRVLEKRGENEHEHILTLFRLHAFALNTADTVAAGRALDALAASPEWAQDNGANLGDALDLGVTDALFSVGDRTRAQRSLAAMTARHGRERGGAALRHACTAEIWRTAHGDTSSTTRTVRALTGVVPDVDSAKFYGWQPKICIAGLAAELSVARHVPDAGSAVARFDSLMASGPRGYGMTFGNLWASRLYLRVGEPARSLAAVSRRHRNWDEVLYLADMDGVVAELARNVGTSRQRQEAEARLRVFRGPGAVSLLH